MSGHKRTTVSISEEEYRQLHDAEMKMRFMDKFLPQTIEKVKEENNIAINKAVENMTNRQERFFSIARDLQTDIRSIEWQTGNAIQQHAIKVGELLKRAETNLGENLQYRLDQFSQQFKAEIAYQHAQSQMSFCHLEDQFNQLYGHEAHKQELALAWAQSAELICTFILNNYPSEWMAPNQIEEMEIQLRQSYLNLDQGAPEAALVLAQQVYFRGSLLRIELENKMLENSLLREAACQSFQQLVAWAEKVGEIPAIDLKGNELDLIVNVNYWSEGLYQTTVDNLKYHLKALSENWYSDNSIYQTILEKEIPYWQKSLEDLVFNARVKVIDSQIRINIAELVICALQEQGYLFDQGNYLDGDMRSGYEAMLSSLDGSQVVIRVDPIEQREGSSEVHLISLDRAIRTERELQQRAHEVSKSLERYGLAVGERSVPARRSIPQTVQIDEPYQVQVIGR